MKKAQMTKRELEIDNKLYLIGFWILVMISIIIILYDFNEINDLKQERESLYDKLIDLQTKNCYLKYPLEKSTFDIRNITSYIKAEENTRNLKDCRNEILPHPKG